MAKGYPDFFGYSMFPYRGKTAGKSYNGQVVGIGGGLGLVGLTSKGVSGGGYLHIYNATALAGITIFASVDDIIFQPIALSDMINQIGANALGMPYKITEYNEADMTASLIFQPDIPFGFEYILFLNNGSGAAITVKSQVMYNEIV